MSSRPNRRRRRAIRRVIRRQARALARRIRRATRRRLRRTLKTLAARHTRRLARRAERRHATRRARAEAGPLAPRSITGTPRPARSTPASAPRATPAAGRPAAPMKQRVKRTKDGKFNGSSGGGKKSAAKKITNSALTPEARKAAQIARTLAAGNNRVARIDKRTDAADQRIDRMFRP